MPRDIERSKNWAEAKVAAGAAGFRTKFDKWLPVFLTDAEEKVAMEKYARFKAATEKSAAEAAAAPKTKTIGGGVGEASATVEVKLKKKPESGDKPSGEKKPEQP